MRIGKALLFLERTKNVESDVLLTMRLRLLVKSHQDWVSMQEDLGRDLPVATRH